MIGASNGHITLLSKIKLTDFEKQEGSFKALVRIMSGILTFIVSLFLL